MNVRIGRIAVGLLFTLFVTAGYAQDLAERVSEYTLDNGLRIIMVEQDFAPVVSINLMFDVGGVDEPPGLGGIAHMVEHMAFKGTRTIGSFDVAAELAALEELEVAAKALEYAEGADIDDATLAAFEERFAAARERAQSLASPNALDNLFSANGGVGLNASTGYDRTDYRISLPANRLELYARVYADVMQNTVFRGFYEERDVVREERRQRSEDSPQGVLFEAFLAEAFRVHPYGVPLIGPPDEIEGYLATEAEAIFDLFYHPNRAVLVIVGDVEPERDIEMLERYFGTWPRGPEVRPEIPEEPAQTAERRVEVTFDAEPQLLIGYRKPTVPERDAYVMDVVDYVLSNGRTSRLFDRLVTEEQAALSVSTSSSFPGTRFPNQFVIIAQPQAPTTPAELEAVIYEELERLATEPISESELTKAKNQLRANTIRALQSGSSLASNLAYHELFLGGWERLIDDLEIYDSVTAEDIMAVAERYFVEEGRTVATLMPEESAAQAPEGE
ncbi:MAG: pitrilysin family protein [Trueperaceae bacterium]|nr:pitrilysin family protein [Trueperaceae bacterium]